MHELVQTIADETFAYLFATPQVPIGEANSAWLAISEENRWRNHDPGGMGKWVPRDSRRTGIGKKLLAHAESEIRGRGHHTFRLRVVKSNRKFSHEKFGHAMLEMIKLGEPLTDRRTSKTKRRRSSFRAAILLPCYDIGIANIRAVQFYQSQGWRVVIEMYPTTDHTRQFLDRAAGHLEFAIAL